MKTTIEIPDDLYRRSKARAAMSGTSLKEFVTAALRDRLAHGAEGAPPVEASGWRRVFGRARRAPVAQVARVIEQDLAQIEAEGWR